MERHLKSCVEHLKELYGDRVIFVGLIGAQNYSLQSESSDYDFKAIVTPCLDDIIFNKKPVSITIEIEDGLCDVKDIRLMMGCWKKQNVNFVELLFTDCKWISPDYKEILQPLFTRREEIVHYDEKHALDCCRGMMMEKYHALFKPYPAQKEVVEKYGYAAKQLSHIFRLEDLVSKYILHYPYKVCLTPNETMRKDLIGIKTYKVLYTDMEEVAMDAKVAMENVDEMLGDFTPAEVNEEVGKMMDKVTADVIRKALRRELMEGKNVTL